MGEDPAVRDLRASLLWLSERLEVVDRVSGGGDPTYPDVCGACGHTRHAHVVNGDADNPTPWPCAYPKNLGAPHGLCRCLDFLPQGGPDE